MGGAITSWLELRPIDKGVTDGLAAVVRQARGLDAPVGRGFSRSETEEFVAAQAGHWRTIGFGL
jgi:hypothetical protein